MDVKMSIRLKALRDAIVEEVEADYYECELTPLAVDQIDRILQQAFELGAKHSPPPTTQEAST